MPDYVVAIEDLQRVQAQLATQAGELVTAQAGVDATVRDLTDAVTAGIAAAQQRVEGQLGELAGTVGRSRSLADAARWNGPDSEQFRAGTEQLLATIEQARDQLLTGVEAHRAGAAALRDQVDAASTVFEEAARATAESTARLDEAVATEATSYEQAFNGSFGYAGGPAAPPPGGEPVPGPPAPGAAPPPAEEAEGGEITTGDVVHGVLDVLGFVPVLGAAPDLINAAIYAVQGDKLGAAISVGAAVPIVGDAGKAGIMAFGLASKGLRAARGTRVRLPGVPSGWRIRGTKTGGGVKYHDPANPGNSVRVMQGNPNSPYPNSQAPYVRWQRNGQPLDGAGNVLPSANVPDAHIPLDEFRFRLELFE